MNSYRKVRSAERTLLVLKSLNRRPITRIEDLMGDTNLSASTLVRLLETLSELGYVHKQSRRTGYVLTERVLELSSGYHGTPLFIDHARPILNALTDRLLWPAALATREGDSMVVRLSTIPQSPLAHTHSTLQKRLDILTRAHGRAYLAFCPAGERKELLKQLGSSLIKKEQSEKRLTPVLDRIRRLGYAERSHDLDPETTTLAKPIMTSKRVMATIGITFFKGARANRKEIVAALGEAANEIGELADSST